MLNGKNIAIVGAGIAGLAAGISLTRAGHRVVLYERFSASLPIGSGLMIQPTGLAALARLGLRDEIEKLGARIGRLHGQTQSGVTIFNLDYADLDPNFYAIGVQRAALHAVLWHGFAGSGAGIETGQEATAFEPCAGGGACLVFRNGRRSPPFDLVIDASGSRSGLRAAATGRKPRSFSYGAVWASAPDRSIAPSALTQRYVAARIMIGHLPLGKASHDAPPLIAFFWSLKPEHFAQWSSGFHPWRDQVLRLWPALESIVAGFSGPEEFTLARYAHFSTSRPFRGPLALIGDAAHATSPQLGQGANNALLDALALTDALERFEDIDAALAAYTRFRRDHVRFYQWASMLLTPFFQSDSRLMPLLRDIAFDRLKLIPYFKREMLRTLAGVKTGLFSNADPAALAGSERASED
jgi:2-polyprenyl-6-methoxyphenol hydroxylase-like FAD-dependent oxidoreductase